MISSYSEEELSGMLRDMQAASSAFYRAAVHIGCHSFIEFTGLMNEYIQMCQVALAMGQDFTETSIHGGKPLPMLEHHRQYLTEKLECIYGCSLEAIERSGARAPKG